MATITYVEFDGTEHRIDVETGYSVMEGAVKNGVPGIDAECGGACACATCTVFIGEAWRDRLPAPDDMEEGMLEFAERTDPGARLACQIKVDDVLNGLVVRMPENQR